MVPFARYARHIAAQGHCTIESIGFSAMTSLLMVGFICLAGLLIC